MEASYLLVRYGELFLKGKNRGLFEQQLIRNIKAITGQSQIKKIQGRLLLPYFPGHHSLRRVFGLTSYSLCIRCELEIEAIKQGSLMVMGGRQGRFRVETNRADKRFPLKSPEINRVVGQFLEKHAKGLQFSFNNAEYVLRIEINHAGCFLFMDSIPCLGGLPTGVEGSVSVLIEDNGSILAGLRIMKRGVIAKPLIVGKKAMDLTLLQRYSPFLLEAEQVPDFEAAEKMVLRSHVPLFVSGQNLQQYSLYPTRLTVLRPLISYRDDEIQKELSRYAA